MTQFTETNFNERIESSIRDNRFVSSQYCILAAGPPRLREMGFAAGFGAAIATNNQIANQMVYPIGGLQAYNLAHNKALQRVYEVGSRRFYWLPSHSVGQLMLNRVYYHGPSLLRLLYAYFSDAAYPEVIFPTYNTFVSPPNPHNVMVSPGYDNIFLAMCSDMFDQPFGMLLYIKDNNDTAMGAVYLESAMIPSHNWSGDAMGGAIQEAAVVQFEWMVPVQVNQLALQV